MVRHTAAEQWFDALSRMESNTDRALVVVATVHVANQGVQRGGAMFGLKVAGGAALNVTTLGAVATYTIWSEVHRVATSDDPLYYGADAVLEMFDPAYIVVTRGVRFYEAMQDFEFEEAGEALGEAEFVVGAVVAGSVPKLGGAAAADEARAGAQALNRAGQKYPKVIDPRTGAPIATPPPGLTKVPISQRVPWGPQQRGAYIKEWYDRGFATPEGGWGAYDIHHILPREYGGTNAFENLVPVPRDTHVGQLNPWWRNYQ